MYSGIFSCQEYHYTFGAEQFENLAPTQAMQDVQRILYRRFDRLSKPSYYFLTEWFFTGEYTELRVFDVQRIKCLATS